MNDEEQAQRRKAMVLLATQKYGRTLLAAKMQELFVLQSQENEDIVKMNSILESNEERLARLLSLGLNLEYIVMGAQMIEHSIKRLIKCHILCINNGLVLGDFSTSLSVATPKLDIPMGPLIQEFQKYCRDQKLVDDLKAFSKKRNEAVHNIYEKFQNLVEADRQLQEYVHTLPVHNLSNRLADLHLALVGELVSKMQDYGVPMKE